jgi:hypothetical protein
LGAPEAKLEVPCKQRLQGAKAHAKASLSAGAEMPCASTRVDAL